MDCHPLFIDGLVPESQARVMAEKILARVRPIRGLGFVPAIAAIAQVKAVG